MFRVFGCALLFICSLSHATQLTVVTEQWPPFNYQDDQGLIKGSSTEIVQKVLAKANIDYQITFYPWIRAYKIASQTPNVLIYSIYPTQERKPFFHWFCPLVSSEPFYVWGLSARTDLVVAQVSDLNHYRFAMTKMDYPYYILKKHGVDVKSQVDFSSEDTLNLKKLLAGRVDFLVTTRPSIIQRLALAGLAEDTLTAVWLLDTNQDNQLCMALNIDSDPAIVQAIFQSFEQLVQENVMAQK